MHALAWSPPAWLLVLLVLSGPLRAAAAARRLAQPKEWREDPSGYNAFAAARVFDMPPGRNTKRAITPEAAESTVTSTFAGIWRNAADKKESVSVMATVEADPVTSNPNRRKFVPRPRARSAIDVPGGKRPNVASGHPQFPAIAAGNIAISSTYEGAIASSTSDSLLVNQGAKTTRAQSMLVGAPRPLPRPGRASRQGSYATTAAGATAIANSGVADGNIVLAQGGEAVAIAIAGRSRADSWQEPPEEPKRKKGGSRSRR